MTEFGSFYTYALFALFLELEVSSHPQCLDFLPPFVPRSPLSFCRRHSSIGCCTASDDSAIEQRINQLLNNTSIETDQGRQSKTCFSHFKALVCTECSQWSQHLYDRDLHQFNTSSFLHFFPAMCPDYCNEFFTSCRRVRFLRQLLGDDFPRNILNYCHNTQKPADPTYCYPFEENASKQWKPSNDWLMCKTYVCLKPIVSQLRNPLAAVSPGDGTKRLFIIEQIGVIHIIKNHKLLPQPFLDLTNIVVDLSNTRADERGMLGMAFHPQYKTNGRFFVYYMAWIRTRQKRHILLSRISEFTVSDVDANIADHSSERVVMEIEQPRYNHNGGQLLFGDDGFLYVFLGDGGAAGDPFGRVGNGQNRSSLLGSVLRIDVDSFNSTHGYSVPRCNPFVGVPNMREEIYSYGFRNPWRCSFDRGNATGSGRGRLFCGDVGQHRFEEVDIVEKGGNYGWRGKEGPSCFNYKECLNMENERFPIFHYHHSIGKSVTGGYVYRGCQFPTLQGKYILGDYDTGRLFALSGREGSDKWSHEELCLGDKSVCHGGVTGKMPRGILSFGEDEDGELYVLAVPSAYPSKPLGTVFQIVEPYTRASPEDCAVYRSRPVGVHPLPRVTGCADS